MKFIMMNIFLFSGQLLAADTSVVLEDSIRNVSIRARVKATFFMNTTTGEGSAKVSVTDQEFDDYDRFPRPPSCDQFGCRRDPFPPTPRIFTVYKKTVRIPQLRLENKQMIYSSQGKETNCGYLGRSRVFKRPTLFLNGNCKLDSRLSSNRLTVTLTVN